MPLRFLIYSGMLYDKYAQHNKLRLYSPKLQPIPIPKCICFYNGKDEQDDRRVLRLSDSFCSDVVSDIEVTVTMINVNYGHNKELLDACEPMNAYSWFVSRVAEKQRTAMTENLERAIDEALEEMPD